MSYPNVPQTSMSQARATFADWGVAYKVALGVMAVGVFMVVLSPFVGGLLYSQGITPLIDLLGAPEERELFSRQEPRTGIELLALLGGYNVAVAICIFCARLVLELLGLAGAPTLTRGMRPPGKLALGTAAAGVVVFAAAALPSLLIDLLFVDYESLVPGTVAKTLDMISQAGRLLVVCAVITLFLRGALLRWTDVVGWGRIRCGWISKLALALIAGGLVSMLRFVMPFDDVATPFANTGVTVLVLGIIPQLLARGRP